MDINNFTGTPNFMEARSMKFCRSKSTFYDFFGHGMRMEHCGKNDTYTSMRI